ncbi:PRD domain-containing protein [Vagococcus xieshaowenii]|uniref:PRD domain-containing protein n=1 Tax=Vagococcus xieshaowenii TaxID=2562451 RepID=A0AAJ5JKP0_9ENTE|nr:PRD domain-containing protein [Vagococcus xieshaowenii]QCA29367.1 PRD domain-containing protein [Vagococcus xieshaowenii]TFZ39341.1 PRD domain-containing protein [Vagococcus xieshaowenii]
MKVLKVFNQNAVLVCDEGQDKIVTGKGIGFSRKRHDVIRPEEVERVYVTDESKNKMMQLLEHIHPEFFIISEEIIAEAEKALNLNMNEHIHLVLADHIAFAVERMKSGIIMQNKLLNEIQIMYPDEFRIAQWAVARLKKHFSLDFPLDEAAYIAIHFHSAINGKTNPSKSLREVTIVSEMVELIGERLAIDFSKMSNSLDYSRLVLHLRYAIERVYQGKLHSMDQDVLDIVKTKYEASYQIALDVTSSINHYYHLNIPSEEIGYLTLHIERLKNQVQSSDHKE